MIHITQYKICAVLARVCSLSGGCEVLARVRSLSESHHQSWRRCAALARNIKSNGNVPDHVTFLNQVTYSGNLVQTELPIERKPNQITFG